MTDTDLDLVDTGVLVAALQRRMEAKGGFATISLCFPTKDGLGDVYHSFARSEGTLAAAQSLVRHVEAALAGVPSPGWDGIEDR